MPQSFLYDIPPIRLFKLTKLTKAENECRNYFGLGSNENPQDTPQLKTKSTSSGI